MGPAALNGPCPRRGGHDSIRDGANRIDARERLPERGGGWTSSTANTPSGHFRSEPSTKGGLLSTKIFSGFWVAENWGLTWIAKTQAMPLSRRRGRCDLV